MRLTQELCSEKNEMWSAGRGVRVDHVQSLFCEHVLLVCTGMGLGVFIQSVVGNHCELVTNSLRICCLWMGQLRYYELITVLVAA